MTTRVRIIVDRDPLNPRTSIETSGRMVCWHHKYSLGDKHSYDCDKFLRELAFEGSDSLRSEANYLESIIYARLYDRALELNSDDPNEYARLLINGRVDRMVGEALSRGGWVILPLYLLDQHGVSVITNNGCPLFRTQVGWIICDNETVQREFNGDWARAEEALRVEVSAYDDYLTGNVYGFIVEDDGKEIDTCWGFSGRDVHTNGMADYFRDCDWASDGLDAELLISLADDAEVEYSTGYPEVGYDATPRTIVVNDSTGFS